MNNLIHLLKELKVPAIEKKIYIKPLGEQSEQLINYQIELDFENHNEEQ